MDDVMQLPGALQPVNFRLLWLLFLEILPFYLKLLPHSHWKVKTICAKDLQYYKFFLMLRTIMTGKIKVGLWNPYILLYRLPLYLNYSYIYNLLLLGRNFDHHCLCYLALTLIYFAIFWSEEWCWTSLFPPLTVSKTLTKISPSM